jgi:hypothetical protein
MVVANVGKMIIDESKVFVIRSKENHLSAVRELLGARLFRTIQEIEAWLDAPSDALDGRTPRATIEAGEGWKVEQLAQAVTAGS